MKRAQTTLNPSIQYPNTKKNPKQTPPKMLIIQKRYTSLLIFTAQTDGTLLGLSSAARRKGLPRRLHQGRHGLRRGGGVAIGEARPGGFGGPRRSLKSCLKGWAPGMITVNILLLLLLLLLLLNIGWWQEMYGNVHSIFVCCFMTSFPFKILFTSRSQRVGFWDTATHRTRG